MYPIARIFTYNYSYFTNRQDIFFNLMKNIFTQSNPYIKPIHQTHTSNITLTN